MKTKITIRPDTACLLFKVCSTLLIGFIVFEPTSPAHAQTGVYTLNGGAAVLVGVTNSTSTADQSGIFVYNSGTLTVGTVTISTSSGASNTNNSDIHGYNAGNQMFISVPPTDGNVFFRLINP